jgi:hypothetical protein
MFEWLFGRRKRLLETEVSSDELQLLDQALWQATHELAEYHPNVHKLLKQFYVTDMRFD